MISLKYHSRKEGEFYKERRHDKDRETCIVAIELTKLI
jgi:hypothetical protein